MEKWCFRFSAKFWASQWLAISFDSSNLPEAIYFDAQKKGQKPLEKPTKKTHPPSPNKS
jgi:hypothetical protein